MSDIRTVGAILDTIISYENILRVCEMSHSKFSSIQIFYDESWQGMPEGTILSPEQTASKFFSFLDDHNNHDDTPVLAVYNVSSNLHITQRSLSWNMLQANHNIEIRWGCLDATEKTFESGEKRFNYPFFIEKFLDIYEPFGIVSLEATYF